MSDDVRMCIQMEKLVCDLRMGIKRKWFYRFHPNLEHKTEYSFCVAQVIERDNITVVFILLMILSSCARSLGITDTPVDEKLPFSQCCWCLISGLAVSLMLLCVPRRWQMQCFRIIPGLNTAIFTIIRKAGMIPRAALY